MFTRDAKRMHLPIGIDDVRFGHLRTFRSANAMSALSPKADIETFGRNVR
jgi:hypothetical protein